jgi:uncharacterized membrane protein YhiD involved in acid resistance
MPEFLKAVTTAPPLHAGEVLTRLIAAALLGWAVVVVYRRTRRPEDIVETFPTTLVLLAILIAMVTQVIGDNIARAFGLVGALSIVRFRTVVRDTQDTAYVIWAVVVGMAAGAGDPWVALIGFVVTGMAALLMRPRAAAHVSTRDAEALPWLVRIRVGLGADFKALVEPSLSAHLSAFELQSVETAKQGISVDIAYRAALRDSHSAEELLKALNRLDGVQHVHLDRQNDDDDD